MSNKNIFGIILKNINFIVVVILYLMNKKKINFIDKIYYVKTDKSPKNDLIINKYKDNNHITFYHNIPYFDDDLIDHRDKLHILSHLTLLRMISRNKKNNFYFIIENNYHNNFQKELKIVSKLKVLKRLPIFHLVNNIDLKDNSICYIINRLSAKILIIVYMMAINRIYLD